MPNMGANALEKNLSTDTERHAHWKQVKQVTSDCLIYGCSECGRTVMYSSDLNTLSINERFPYCHCGCKMDEVSK